MQPAATEKPLGPFEVSLKDPEPETPEANANVGSIIPPKTEVPQESKSYQKLSRHHS